MARRSSSGASTAASRALDGVILVTDRELFGTVRVRMAAGAPAGGARRMRPRRLTPGDTVVHADHGVARYAGLVR
ncbi:MAG: hypothetical protein R3C32_13240 [Chloroflexota bacterium]